MTRGCFVIVEEFLEGPDILHSEERDESGQVKIQLEYCRVCAAWCYCSKRAVIDIRIRIDRDTTRMRRKAILLWCATLLSLQRRPCPHRPISLQVSAFQYK